MSSLAVRLVENPATNRFEIVPVGTSHRMNGGRHVTPDICVGVLQSLSCRTAADFAIRQFKKDLETARCANEWRYVTSEIHDDPNLTKTYALTLINEPPITTIRDVRGDRYVRAQTGGEILRLISEHNLEERGEVGSRSARALSAMVRVLGVGFFSSLLVSQGDPALLFGGMAVSAVVSCIVGGCIGNSKSPAEKIADLVRHEGWGEYVEVPNPGNERLCIQIDAIPPTEEEIAVSAQLQDPLLPV